MCCMSTSAQRTRRGWKKRKSERCRCMVVCRSGNGKSLAQCPRSIGMCGGSFGNGTPHLDEFVDHAAVDLQVHRYAGHAQAVGVGHALVDQWITFRQAHPGGRYAAQIDLVSVRPLAIPGGKAPVAAVVRGTDVLLEEIGDMRLLNHKTRSKGAVRGRV